METYAVGRLARSGVAVDGRRSAVRLHENRRGFTDSVRGVRVGLWTSDGLHVAELLQISDGGAPA